MKQRLSRRYLRAVFYLFITLGIMYLVSLTAAGSSESKSIEAVFSKDIRTPGADESFSLRSSQVISYTGYGRHVDGRLIADEDDLRLSVSVEGGIIKGSLSRLSDYEDWKVRVIVRRTVRYEREDGTYGYIYSDHTYDFSGCTSADPSCSDGYELSEKLRKYDSVIITAHIRIPEDVGRIVLDGKGGEFKKYASSFDKITISGERPGLSITGQGTVILVNEGISADISRISISSAGGYCIDNGGSRFGHTCDKVIVVSGHHDMSPKVDFSAAAVGHSRVVLSDVTLDSKETAFYNGGTADLKGKVSISGKTGLYNMGSVDARPASLYISASQTGVANASWIGIVMNSLHKKDDSYTDKELGILASSLAGDLTEYIPGSIIFSAGGNGDTVISASDTAIANGGVLELYGGRVSGGVTGIDNNGSFSFKGGVVSGSRFGVLQNGTLMMYKGGVVKSDSVLHLTPGHIILYCGECPHSLAARVSLANGDRNLGREIIRRTDGRSDQTGALCGDTANGILPISAPFEPAFETVGGHVAVFRKGRGTSFNGKEESVYLSALFHGIYKDGLNCPPVDLKTDLPEETPYFWREEQTFETDISKKDAVRIYFEDRDISSGFRLLSWMDNAGTYKNRIKRVYESDHVFTATWDLSIGIRYHGNHDTDQYQSDSGGSRDITYEPMGIGDRLFSNIIEGEPYFVREEKASEAGVDYTQRYLFIGWNMGGELYKPGYVIKDLDFLYDALRANSFSLRGTGKGNQVIVDMDAVWDAYPRVSTRTVYLYDNSISDKEIMIGALLERGCIYALDKEDGTLKDKNVTVCTDPSGKVFDPKALCNLGGSGSIRVYYSATDSRGNRSLWPGSVCIMTSDDQDLDVSCNEIKGSKTPCGGSADTEDSSISYIRYIGRDTVNSLLPASVWRGTYSKSLDAALSCEVSDGRICYSASRQRDILRAIDDERSGTADADAAKAYLRAPSSVLGSSGMEEAKPTDESTGVRTVGTPRLRLIMGDTGKVTVLLSPAQNAGGYEIQRCRADTGSKEEIWEKRVFLSGADLRYDRMDEDLKSPLYAYTEDGLWGVYRYRVRAFLSVKGRCDETMPNGKWSEVKETGYLGPVSITTVTSGIRSIYIKWKALPKADGYVIYLKRAGEDERRFTVEGGKTETVLTNKVDEGEYTLWVCGFTGKDKKYYSNRSKAVKAVVKNADPPAASFSGGRIRWQSLPGAIRYEITERRVSDGVEKAYDTITGCSIGTESKGLCEYMIRAVYERLDGKEISSESEYILSA